MSANHVFAIVLAAGLVNGVLGPYWVVVLYWAPLWVPTWLPGNPQLLIYLASMIAATTTVILAGVPVALAEGAFPALRKTTAAMWLWAACATALAVPAVLWRLSLA